MFTTIVTGLALNVAMPIDTIIDPGLEIPDTTVEHAESESDGHRRPSNSSKGKKKKTKSSAHKRPGEDRRPDVVKTHERPAHVVHHVRPKAPTRTHHVVHHPPPKPRVVHHRWAPSHPRWHWTHGVFFVDHSDRRPNAVRPNHARPDRSVNVNRKIDRDGDVAVGLKAGNYVSGYQEGGSFADGGIGVMVRYRPVEAIGLELSYSYYDDSFDENRERTTSVVQPSVQLFALPWSRVSPYGSVGVTLAQRSYDDNWGNGDITTNTKVNDKAFGPHAGLGIEFALGENVALDLEGRGISFWGDGNPDTSNVAFQANGSLNFYF